MRFEIVIDDSDRDDPGTAGNPWTACLYDISDDGESGEMLASGVGATPQAAVADLLSDWAEEGVRGCSCGMADYGAPGHDGGDPVD